MNRYTGVTLSIRINYFTEVDYSTRIDEQENSLRIDLSICSPTLLLSMARMISKSSKSSRLIGRDVDVMATPLWMAAPRMRASARSPCVRRIIDRVPSMKL